MEAVRRGDRQHRRVVTRPPEPSGGGGRVVRDRALIGDHRAGPRRRRAHPVAPRDHALGEARGAGAGLLQRPGREAQVDRPALLGLQVAEGPLHHGGELVREGGLVGREAALPHADQGRRDGLVRPALRRERDPRGRARHEEAGVAVAGVVERIEAPRDERVVERADRDQAPPEEGVRQPRDAQREEEVHLRDAELEVLAVRAEGPLLRRGHALVAEGVAKLAPVEEPAPVHPRAEVGRHGDVRRHGEDAVRERAALPRDAVQDLAERRLGRDLALGGGGQRRDGDRVVRQPPRPAREERRRPRRRGEVVGHLPFGALGHPHRRPPVGELRRGHQARVVVLVPGERRAPALDRVGDEHRRQVVPRGGVERVAQRLEAVPPERRHQRRELRVAPPREEGRDLGAVADLRLEAGAPGRAALPGERRVERVRAVLDPRLEPLAPRLREGRALRPAVPEAHHAPAEGAEHGLDPLPQPLPHHPVERLAVVVDHPPAVAQVVLPALLQRLVDVALVELGVADERDHAPLGPVRAQVVLGVQVVLHQRAEHRRGHPEADRARREVDVVRVLRAARVALRAAVAAERFERGAGQPARHALDRVEDGRGVRLHRDAVLGAQRVEVERGEDVDHGGGRRLMPADLHLALALRAQVVGVVDRPVREPQRLPRQRVQPLRLAPSGHGLVLHLRGPSLRAVAAGFGPSYRAPPGRGPRTCGPPRAVRRRVSARRTGSCGASRGSCRRGGCVPRPRRRRAAASHRVRADARRPHRAVRDSHRPPSV